MRDHPCDGDDECHTCGKELDHMKIEKELLTRAQFVTIFNFLRIQGQVSAEKAKLLSKEEATKLIGEFQFVKGDDERKVALSKKYNIHNGFQYVPTNV